MDLNWRQTNIPLDTPPHYSLSEARETQPEVGCLSFPSTETTEPVERREAQVTN